MATSRKISDLLEEDSRMLDRAELAAKRLGADPKNFCISQSAGRMIISGFVFPDESKVDQKLFVRVRHGNTPIKNAWRPRVARSGKNKDPYREFKSLCSDGLRQAMDLLQLPTIRFDPDLGMIWSTPGICFVGRSAYLTTHESVDAMPGCRRISDLQYEKATSGVKTTRTIQPEPKRKKPRRGRAKRGVR